MTIHIDASLFAHIENDANLSGTFGLEGNNFSNTTQYFQQYLLERKKSAKYFPAKYEEILKDMKYLVAVEAEISKSNAHQAQALGEIIAEEFVNLQPGEKRCLPGGWINKTGGHGMIYQISRREDGFYFTAINAGAGLKYHQKNSGLDKELYNPMKTWHFPAPETKAEQAELGFFIARLLEAQINPSYQNKAVNEQTLYEQILPSISHIDGKEIQSEALAPFAYTGGQLSGTCTQRCLHQMLKINSKSAKEYERFIFEFKHFALNDYSKGCLSGKQPLTQSAKQQINLAIDNNIKILKTPGVFSKSEIESYFSEIKRLRKRINEASTLIEQKPSREKDPFFNLTIKGNANVATSQHFAIPDCNLPPIKPLKPCSKNFSSSLQNAINFLERLENPAAQYYYLQKLIPAWSIDTENSLYSEVKSLANYEVFSRQVDNLQTILQNLQSNWLKEAQIPGLNIMTLQLVALQMNIQSVIADKKKLPDFKPFVATTMQLILSNTERNAFWATNNPLLDNQLQNLRDYFSKSPIFIPHDSFYTYLKALIEPHPQQKLEQELHDKLQVLYNEHFAKDSTKLHEEIRKNGLQLVYMIAQHFLYRPRLNPEFYPLINKIKAHLEYESQIRASINPFFKEQLSPQPQIDFWLNRLSLFRVTTPLAATFICGRELSDKSAKPRYLTEASLALDALLADTTTNLKVKTANEIQLQSLNKVGNEQKNKVITQEDIVGRDYFHLRSVPSLQISLTLDYFRRHIAELDSESIQLYVEANLMQPGLLCEALKNSDFLPQFAKFLKKGELFFNKNGQYSRESLWFLRLDFLVSRYLYFTDKQAGLSRLQKIQKQLLKQLSQPNAAEIIYVQQQYLFLTLMTQISLNEDPGELFALATDTYFYLQGHANLTIHKDISHSVDLDSASAKYQLLVSLLAAQSSKKIESVLEKVLAKQYPNQQLKILNSDFPKYYLEDSKKQLLETNILLGKIFENQLARSSLPLTIKNHPLIKHLGLQDTQACLMNANETYMVLPPESNEIRLFCNDKHLRVQKKWKLGGDLRIYELQALSKNHQAYHASNDISVVDTDLPAILTDSMMDYWQDVNCSEKGLLSKNNKPVYYVEAAKLYPINQGEISKEPLTLLDTKRQFILNRFESNNFILAHKGQIKLPRYDLAFQIINDNNLILQETGELVIERPPSIHPAMAGLSLKRDQYLRYLMPVARFYAKEEGAVTGNYYPVVHDTTGTIAKSILKTEWQKHPPLQTPLWDYQQSERHISFRIQDGELVADNAADALYLAYTHLATHQPEKAWKVLDDCNKRLGGLTGNPSELQFIAWICNDLPHRLSDNIKVIKKTSPYLSCQLKAVSLLCDYLLQDRTFELKEPQRENNANSHYALLQHNSLKQFINELPTTIYKNYKCLQTMSRHLEHNEHLSELERKRLLFYYQDSQSGPALGALGYEWMRLSILDIRKEHGALLARIASGMPSAADKNRLALIDEQLDKIKPVVSQSTMVEKVAIDLSLPRSIKIKTSNLSLGAKTICEAWVDKLSWDNQQSEEETNRAIELLSSNMSEDDFITHFPVYFAVTDSSNLIHRKRLSDFCTRTLIANRHVPLDKQESNIPLLSNILYRLLNLNSREIIEQPTLSKLVNKVPYYHVPPLEVYQAKDIYQDILATKDDLLAKELQKPKPLFTNTPLHTALLAQSDMKEYLDGSHRKLLDNMLAYYRSLSETGAKKIAEAKTEELAGKELFALEQEQRYLGQCLLKDSSLILLIQDLVSSVETPLAAKTEQAWGEALRFANRGPDDAQQKRAWMLDKESKARGSLQKSDLISLYCAADATLSIEKTGLNVDNAQELHDLIHSALFQELQSLLIKNLSRDFARALAENDLGAATQVLDLLAKERIPGLDEPAVMLLQRAEETLLRPRQVEALKDLLQQPENGRGFAEKIEKIIPGGGKSKVIIPILAEKKAQGDNLVVVEVPSALLATNHVDLNRGSQRLFGKRAYRFEFNRDSNCSPKRLEALYQQFREIMTTRSYMVTTGEAIQSLELKYIELLLLNEEKQDKDWEKQVYWLDKINSLFRNSADCIIDEVHLGLWLKKRLNYTTGHSDSIGPALIHNAVALYSYIEMDFIHNAPKLPEDYDWSNFKKELAKKLVCEPEGPLNNFVKEAVLRYGESVKEELIDYIRGGSKTLCEAVSLANSQDKAALAFFKQQVSLLLSETLPRKLNVNYGCSQQQLSPIEYTLAIPYVGNDIADEKSRFGNELVAINTSIQMMFIKGISKELFAERIAEWQALARQELSQNTALKHLDETAIARGFALLEGNMISLSQVNIKNSVQMEGLHQRYKNNRSLQFSLLKERVLKGIRHDGEVIHSDSFNHVDQYRSMQGISGTPNNNTTFHQRLIYNGKSSLGSDDYLVELLAAKKVELSHLDFTNLSQFLDKALTHSKAGERTRAIIDINATFTGVTNLEVAKEIAKFVTKNPDFFSNKIKHVLYFNAEQVLCALDINKPDLPIVLGTSDEKEISRILCSTPKERFTYYDQVHTLGADIKQYQQAHALVLIDEKESFQRWVQGNLRMRDLANNQTVEFILPTRVSGISYERLIERLKNNDKKALAMDNPAAAKGQMNNLLRRICLNMIQALPSEEAKSKARLMSEFKKFVVEIPEQDLFKLYGSISSRQKIGDIFARYKAKMLNLWQDCHTQANKPLIEENLLEMSLKLQKIIDLATPYCLAEYDDLNESSNKDLQVQNEVQKQLQIERLDLNTNYDANLIPAAPTSWKKYGNLHKEMERMTVDLNMVCTDKPLFSSQLKLSINYVITHDYQEEITPDCFLKPIFLVCYYFQEIDNRDILHATIVTPQELKDDALKTLMIKKRCWISTTLDTVVAGVRPPNMLKDANYQLLREQVRFFNGEFSSLLEQNTQLIWLKEEPVEKLNFFENKLQRYRPGSDLDFSLLKTALTQSSHKGFKQIAKFPYQDFSQFDWKCLESKIIPSQVAEYNKLAEAFKYINANWYGKNLSVNRLAEQFALPITALSYVDDHLKHLSALEAFLKKVKKQPFLVYLTAEDKSSFESCLGISFASFCERQQLHDLSAPSKHSPEWQLASVEALELLFIHPALQDLAAKNLVVEDCFKELAKKASSSELLVRILKTGLRSEFLIAKILTNNCCDEAVVNLFFELDINLTEINLPLLATKCQSKELVAKFLSKNVLNEKSLQILCQYPFLDEEFLLNILTRTNSNETIKAVLKHHAASSPRVRTAMLLHPAFSAVLLGECLKSGNLTRDELLFLLNHSPSINGDMLKNILEKTKDLIVRLVAIKHVKCTNEIWERTKFDDKFLRFILDDKELTQTQLLRIVRKANRSWILELVYNHPGQTQHVRETVLRHKELASAFMLSLLDQNNLNHTTIKLAQRLLSREELSEASIEKVLKHNLDYETVDQALRHAKLSSTGRQQWLNNLAADHERMKNLPNTKENKLSLALQALRLKASQHAVKALGDESYSEVARTAVNLYQFLHGAVEAHYQSGRDSFLSLQTSCEEKIRKAEEILGSHRGYKQIFWDILNVFLSGITLKFFWSNNWRYIEAKTASQEIVDEFCEACKTN
jgi:hypothetical protein